MKEFRMCFIEIFWKSCPYSEKLIAVHVFPWEIIQLIEKAKI